MKKALSKIYVAVLTPFVAILGFLLYLLVLFARLVFFIYELIIPRGLREIVPVLNLWRKYLVYASNLFSSHEKIEMVKIEEEIDEIIIKEDRINKAYPIQRGVGETYDHLLIIFVIIAVSVVLVQSQNPSFDVLLDYIEQTFLSGVPPKYRWLMITLIAFVCSTMMGMLSFIATVFGPIYSIFHKSSMRMIRMGAYSWGSIYQRIENLFALPYLASKASFSFFEAPPVDASTFEEFRLDLVGDIDTLRKRFTNVLSVSSFSLPDKTQKLYQEFLSSEVEDRLDMGKIEDSLSRVFSLLLWQKETYVIPWRKEPGLKMFAERNNMTYKEAKETLVFVTDKLKEKFVSKEFYSSILLNGALKGIIKVEEKYEMPISDLEYNQLAFSIALGGQRYVIDHIAKEKFVKRATRKVRNTFIGFFVPFLEFGLIFVAYGKHIGERFKFMFAKGWTKRTGKYMGSKFTEIQKGLNSILLADEPHEELDETAKKEAKESFNMLWKVVLFVFKLILALPLSLYYFAKLFYQMISTIWRKRKPEERIRRKFARDIARETMVAMYQEIYDRLVLETYLYS